MASAPSLQQPEKQPIKSTTPGTNQTTDEIANRERSHRRNPNVPTEPADRALGTDRGDPQKTRRNSRRSDGGFWERIKNLPGKEGAIAGREEADLLLVASCEFLYRA
jgi:hypothetical protein